MDLRPGMGPLAGLETAFSCTDADTVFLTATDLPFGTHKLSEALLERIEDADACVIRHDNGSVEPAFGIYRRSCYPSIQFLLNENRRALRSVFDLVRVRWVEESELPGFDLKKILWNINTPDDYLLALDDCGHTTDRL